MEKDIIALRALSLGSYIIRGELDISVRVQKDPEVLKSVSDLVNLLYSWAKSEDLISYLSPEELESFQKPLGEWNDIELIKSIWKVESLGTLLWALSLIPEIPPYDNLFVFQRLVEKLPLFRSKEGFLESTHLKSMEEIKRERDIAEHWFWRLQLFDAEKTEDKEISFKEIISSVAEKAYLDGYIPKPIDGDFPVLGKPFRELTLEEYTQISFIIVERYNTLNWLCGYLEEG